LSVVAVCLSCFTGFFAIPLALAGLILSLRVQDQLMQGRTEEAARTAFWAGLFGWITVAIVVVPVLLFIFFGGAILAGLAAIISAM
ncbi:MAG: CD225/dispanin family protein, partial [Elusimicrobiaceae bacterium]|nr:CD225/dispanin family protein [Elusimicrobiaceae bacterium]